MASGDHDRRHVAPTIPAVDPARTGDEAARLDTRTAQLDPTELARLVGKTMPEQTRPAIVRTDTEQSIPLERPPVREDERPTGEMIPSQLAELRDQAQHELEPEHSDRPTTELDPSVLRAMMVGTPAHDEDSQVAARERRRHAEQRPFTKPPVDVPRVTAAPPIAAKRDPARSIKTEFVRPLTADGGVPPAFAWAPALVLAVAVIAVIVGVALAR